jgi:AcrR family transcriptional regulator
VDAILTATAQLLVAEGYAPLSTNRIAKRAGVSVGTLYQYFENKEAVVEALVERVATRQLEAFAADLAQLADTDPGIEGGARILLDGILSAQRVDPELSGVLLREAPRGGAQDLQRTWLQRSRQLLHATTYDRRDRFRAGDLDLMLYILVTGVYAVMQDAIAHRPELLRTEVLRDELTVLVTGFLSPPGGTDAPSAG